MIKKIFTKLLLTYVTIILVTLLVVGVFLSQLFQNYYFNMREKELIAKGQEITEVLVSYTMGHRDEETTDDLLKMMDKFLDARVISIDRQTLIFQEGLDSMGIKMSLDELERLLEGNVVTRQGDHPLFKEQMLTVAIPITVMDEVTGGLFLSASMADLSATINQVQRLIFLAALAAVILSTMVGFYLSKSISQPLQQMNEVAMEIAGGNFARKVEVSSSDEVGQLSESFNYMADEIKELDQMRRDFVANVSHELRTPLTSIQGFVEAILDGFAEDEEAEKRYLNIVRDETVRLSRLINDLLDLSRMETGKARVSLVPAHLPEIVLNVVNKLRPQLEKNKLNIKMDIPEDLPPVLADRDRIEQVLINLLNNAIDYTPAGKDISITTHREGGFIHISVRDKGVGIPEGEQAKIWDRFYKVEKSRTRKVGGTGLGLSIVKQIINSHGGTVTLESRPGEGSTFTFSLKTLGV